MIVILLPSLSDITPEKGRAINLPIPRAEITYKTAAWFVFQSA